MTEKIYILLPVYNRREITRRFIECLKVQSYSNYHLLLIDDGSSDGTEEMVSKEIQSLTVIRGNGDWWWAGSLHQGYNWLKSHDIALSDLVLIINDDTEFEADFLQKGALIVGGQAKSLLLAQCYDRRSNKLMDAGVHVDWPRLSFTPAAAPDQINCLSTRGLLLRVSDFFEIGGFYPRILPHYLSDYEFTIRAYRKGMKLITSTSFKLWMDENTTGYHHFGPSEKFLDFLKKYFSNKSALNPMAWTFFIILACPWPWKLLHLLRSWLNTTLKIAYFSLISLTNRMKKEKGLN